MKINNEGSALLTFFLILSSLTLACSIVWLAAILLFDVSLQKQDYESAYQPTRSILNYGILVGKKNFTQVCSYLQRNKTLVLEIPLHGAQANKNRQAQVHMTLQHENSILLRAYLREHDKTIFQSSCELVRGEKVSDTSSLEYYAIHSWNKNATS